VRARLPDERQAIRQAASTAGAAQVLVSDHPLAAVIGAGLPSTAPIRLMVVDIAAAGNSAIAARSSLSIRRETMTDHKKKGDFHKNGKDDEGGNKKQDNSDNTASKDNNQNAGHGGHK
jgi:hypothetical protein